MVLGCFRLPVPQYGALAAALQDPSGEHLATKDIDRLGNCPAAIVAWRGQHTLGFGHGCDCAELWDEKVTRTG